MWLGLLVWTCILHWHLKGNLDEVYDLISKWDKDKIINAYSKPQKKDLIHN